MAMRGQQDKEIEIPTTTTTTLGYNLPNRDSSSSSSKLSSPTVGERSSSDHDQQHHQPTHQTRTLIFNETPHHNLYTPPPRPPALAPHRPTSDPDLSTLIAPTSNPPRTAPPQTTTATTTTSTPSIRYRECLRNHAASMGSHVVDGCGEFMASGEEATPESLRCAACECHRNFHRKEVEGELQPQTHVPNYHSYYTNKHNGHLHYPKPSSSSLHHRLVTPTSLVSPVMMTFGGPAESSSEDLNMFQSNTGGAQLMSVQQHAPLLSSSKKRFRTKFSQHQKDRMMEFADKIDWKIHKHNEQEVQQFCSQVGVKRQVFKVWMHNNKQTTSSKKQQM